MAFWDFFSPSDNISDKNQAASSLKTKLEQMLPQSSEDELMHLACKAGLLARVVYVDLKVEPGEVSSMREILLKISTLDESQIDAIVLLTLKDHKRLAGLENQVYTQYLRKNLSIDSRYNILECLFAMAASDGEASNEESEEIRSICTGIGLDQQHFISARATVLDKLAALKK